MTLMVRISAGVLPLGNVEAKFHNFVSPHFCNPLQMCRYVVAEQHFFKKLQGLKLRTVEKSAIADMQCAVAEVVPSGCGVEVGDRKNMCVLNYDV